MFEKESKVNQPKYISCIKINGVPILPPLITHAKRKEIHKYKQQAIKLEKRLRKELELKDYINKYYAPQLENCTVFTNSLEHRLSFDNLVLPVKNNENLITMPTKDEVPLALQKKTPKLSCDLQVSQYANNEFTVLTNFEKSNANMVAIDNPASSIDTFAYTKNGLENEIEVSSIANQKPRLIRSNSYTLESPSPLLLDHLRRQNESVDDDYIQESRLYSAELQTTKKSQDYDSIYMDDFSGRDLLSISRSESELKNTSIISENDDFSITGSQYQLKEFIDNNLPQMLDNDILLENKEIGAKKKFQHSNNNENENYLNSSYEIVNNSKIVSLSNQLTNCDEQSLRTVLHNIPEIYSKQIIEILEKQKQEQLIKLQKIDVQQSSDGNAKIKPDNQTKSCIYHKVQRTNSFENSHQNTWNRTLEIQDSSLTMAYTGSNHKEALSTEKINTTSDNFNQHQNAATTCSCELFSSSNKKARQPFKEDYAASIIVAAAKGYLVRRLMRTDRIQGLIQTIRDALVCAIQLQSEAINESDVELHRRLIQQVSAACFEFHDVFFSLSPSERMTIIRFDRERQKEKLKRPLSRASSFGKSSRSSRSTTK